MISQCCDYIAAGLAPEITGVQVLIHQSGDCGDLTRMLALFEPVEKHLLERFVVGQHHVPDGASAHKMAHLLGQILGVIARALKRLRHEDDLQARLMMQVFWIFDVPHKNQIPKAVHFAISSQHFDGFLHIAIGK